MQKLDCQGDGTPESARKTVFCTDSPSPPEPSKFQTLYRLQETPCPTALEDKLFSFLSYQPVAGACAWPCSCCLPTATLKQAARISNWCTNQRKSMKKQSQILSWPLRKKLLVFLVVMFLPGFGILVTKGVKQRNAEILEAQNKAFLLTESLSAQQEQVVTTTRTMLTMLAQMREVQRLDAKACDRLFADLQKRYPFFTVILATTPDGKVFAASAPFAPSTSLADRKYIIDAIRTRDFSAGEYILGRVSKQVSLNFSYPVMDAHGRLSAIVVAGFSLNEYQRFVSKLDLPQGYVVLITDWNGIRLFRSPQDPRTPIGEAIVRRGFDQISSNEERGFRGWLAPMIPNGSMRSGECASGTGYPHTFSCWWGFRSGASCIRKTFKCCSI